MKATDRVTWGVSSPVRRSTGALLGLLFCGAVCLAQTQTPPAAQGSKTIVADVIPQGNKVVPTDRVMSLVKTRPGGEYVREVVEEDVRRLYAETHAFADVQVKEQFTPDNKVIVYFMLTEHPSLIQDIIYQGAKHLKQDDLDTLTGLHKGDTLNPITNQRARKAILDRLYEKGRLFASVDLVEGGNRGDTRVVFNITEGPVVKVGGIDFTGNTFVTKARLNTQVNVSRPFLGLIGGDLDTRMVDGDVAKLEEYYRSFGFQDVKVSRELQWEADQKHVDIIFHIQEGQRYRVAGVDVIGAKAMDTNQLLTLDANKKGDWYNQQKADLTKERIKAAYGFRGSDPQVQEEVFYPPDQPGQLVVHYDIYERPPASVGQIIIVGNEVTRQNVILRQIPLYPGQTLTFPDLRVAEKNLARLNIFEMNPETGVRPTVTVLDPDGENPVKDILVNVQETHTGSLMFGVGVNSDAGLTGSIVLNERNFDITRPPTSIDDLLSGHAFRGAGQEFRIEAVPGTQLQRYTVSFREPYLFDSQYSFGISGYYYDRVYNEYTEGRFGTRLTLGRQLNKFWSASVAARIEGVSVNSIPFGAPPQITDFEGNHFLFGLRGAVTRDSRDSYLRPTEGSLVDISFEECLGDYTFPLFNIEANKYFTIYERADGSGRHVLAARSQLSIAGSNTPVYERFYAGGFRSMRGFEFRGVSPDVNGFKVGGDFMFLNSLEYQIPLRANDQIYVVGFIDSGTVEAKPELKDYRVTAGVGLRLVVPMLGPVPIALDFGFPIVKDPADNTQVFSFWVGFFH